MSELVADCPRCGSRSITFDLMRDVQIYQESYRQFYEAFCVCRKCRRATIFILSVINSQAPPYLTTITGCVNSLVELEGYINLKANVRVTPPEYIPTEIEAVFKEGATCLAVQCYNAAGTMFRLCVDIATQAKLPADGPNAGGLNKTIRRSLGLRLKWLFDNGILPEALRDLSSCIKDDGDDGAHAGNLNKDAADDLLDFTTVLLERMYTEPEQVRLAQERKNKRRENLKPTASATE